MARVRKKKPEGNPDGRMLVDGLDPLLARQMIAEAMGAGGHTKPDYQIDRLFIPVLGPGRNGEKRVVGYFCRCRVCGCPYKYTYGKNGVQLTKDDSFGPCKAKTAAASKKMG